MLHFKKVNSLENNGKTLKKMVRDEAHKLLRSVLISRGVPENQHEFIYNDYGKPMLKNSNTVHFNISHCPELAVCADSDIPIGVDIEKIRNFPERIIKRCFTDNEAEYIKNDNSPDTAFFQLWTLKESYIKAIGIGLAYPMKNAEFIIENNSITANTENDFSFAQIIIDNEFICSVCCDSIFNNKVFYRSYEDKVSFESLKF